MTQHQLATTLFLQLAVILAVSRSVSALARYIGQPPVVGELIAGVCLGPSLLGLLAPGVESALFPKESLSLLWGLSQLGLVLYMFLVGTEFDLEHFRLTRKSAAVISLSGIFAPLGLASLLALYLFRTEGLFASNVTSLQAVMFIGAAMCITAFPMLARIISDRGLSGTRVGTLSLAAAAFGDVVAWCILAAVTGSFNGDSGAGVLALTGGSIFAAAITLAVRPLLARAASRPAGMNALGTAVVLMLLMLAASFTHRVGIHAIFGAFFVGTAIPRGIWTARLQAELKPITVLLLVPIFFVSSGLNTQLDLLGAPGAWSITLLIVAVAVAGKWLACALAARVCGETWRDSFAVGALMNARGMMELILLNIGLSHGIITPELFAMLVFMTIVTTLMAAPCFEIVTRLWPQPVDVEQERLAA